MAVLHHSPILVFARFGVAVPGLSPRREIEFLKEQNFMKFEIEDLPKLVRETKKTLRAALPGYAEAFKKVESELRRRVDAIVKERESGQAVVPIVHYSDIAGGSVPAEMIAKIKQRGAEAQKIEGKTIIYIRSTGMFKIEGGEWISSN